ncbi:hypothetical protein VTK73DRAFT_710 [Phialemonium thermophilum]|uniref:Uncharacterized protein n=1 Tax=Phialemonium thermophilum TaxID=223376 RepID=A0ABR3XD26_9PEZI
MSAHRTCHVLLRGGTQSTILAIISSKVHPQSAPWVRTRTVGCACCRGIVLRYLAPTGGLRPSLNAPPR